MWPEIHVLRHNLLGELHLLDSLHINSHDFKSNRQLLLWSNCNPQIYDVGHPLARKRGEKFVLQGPADAHELWSNASRYENLDNGRPRNMEKYGPDPT
jgi:hypothetical protein